MAIIDANIVLRYVLNDHEELSAKAAKIIENQSVTLPLEVACEVVYVLQKVYQIDRQQIQQQLKELVDSELIIVDKSELFLTALDCYSTTKLDFVDTLLCAYQKVGDEEVLTFDNKLSKYLQKES